MNNDNDMMDLALIWTNVVAKATLVTSAVCMHPKHVFEVPDDVFGRRNEL